MELWQKILSEIDDFPTKLNKHNGEILQKNFTYITNESDNEKFSKSIKYKYVRKIDNNEYILIVEYLFRDNEVILDIQRAIGKNYYINRRP